MSRLGKLWRNVLRMSKRKMLKAFFAPNLQIRARWITMFLHNKKIVQLISIKGLRARLLAKKI